jgi:hypothetical protein
MTSEARVVSTGGTHVYWMPTSVAEQFVADVERWDGSVTAFRQYPVRLQPTGRKWLLSVRLATICSVVVAKAITRRDTEDDDEVIGVHSNL